MFPSAVFYLSPFSWVVRSLVLNEFGSTVSVLCEAGKASFALTPQRLLPQKYDDLIPTGPSTFQRKGDFFLDQFGFQKGDGWLYGGIVLLGIGYFFIFGLFLTARALWTSRHKAPIGTKRHLTDDEDAQFASRAVRSGGASPAATPTAVTVGITGVNGASSSSATAPSVASPSAPVRSSAATSGLRFAPATLAFRNVNYDVVLPSKETRRLLRGVTGVARPGTMTALMGASGAGKYNDSRF